ADITHRRHAIIETVFADLIDGPLAHMPSGHFGANSAWVLCAAIAHNLLRAAAKLAGAQHAAARGATLRRKIVNIPARLARPQRKPILHLPSHWPWAHAWLALWHNTIGYLHRQPARPTIAPDTARPGTNKGKAGQTSKSITPAHPAVKINAQPTGPRTPSVDQGLASSIVPVQKAFSLITRRSTHRPIHGFRLRAHPS